MTDKDNAKDDILFMLCELSEDQLDPSVKTKLLALVGLSCKDTKDKLLAILDDCVAGSLCSGFVITTLDLLWRDFCGGTQEELDNRVKKNKQ